MDSSNERSGVFSVARGNAARPFEKQESILNEMAVLVETFIVFPRMFSALSGRNHRYHPLINRFENDCVCNLDVDISEKIKPHQWEKLPWRWVVERTLSWLNHSGPLSKDYEISISSAEPMVKISYFHTFLKRL